MADAASSAGTHDAEAAAWMRTRLAWYLFQSGKTDPARQVCQAALRCQPEFAPALLLQGRIYLADGEAAKAVEVLERAVDANPLPEYYWALTEALTAAGNPLRADLAAKMVIRRGASDDPRTYALFLATRQQQTSLAVQLAQRELAGRADVYTYDAMAWAQYAAGEVASAVRHIELARREGTPDVRIYFHSALIAIAAGDQAAAAEYFDKSFPLRHLLWPSERNQLVKAMAQLNESRETRVAAAP